MDLGPALKVAPPPATAPPPVVISTVGEVAPQTELAPSRVVLAAGTKDGAGLPSGDPRSSGQDVTDRRVTIDADTHEIVRQSVDARTNQVVEQYPDRAILALRAYFDRMSDNAAVKLAAANDSDGRKVTRVQA
jgi:hypothetical protein